MIYQSYAFLITKIILNYFMKQAFLPCPSCGGNRLFLTKYEVPLKILKERSWLVCKDCDFQIPTEKYKKSLFCV